MLLGNDQHAGALELAHKGIHAAGLQQAIQLRQGSCASLKLRAPPDVVITNPPWGQRLAGGRGVARGRRPGRDKRIGVVEGMDEELRGIYEELGDWLKASVRVIGRYASVRCIDASPMYVHRRQARLRLCCLATKQRRMPCTCAVPKSGP